MAQYIRWMVVSEGRSALDASYTPEYFKERDYKKAKERANAISSGYVVDLFKRFNRE